MQNRVGCQVDSESKGALNAGWGQVKEREPPVATPGAIEAARQGLMILSCDPQLIESMLTLINY